MIANQREYEITKGWIEKFELKLRTPLPADDPIDPLGREIERNAIASTLDELREELAQYESTHQRDLVGAEQR